VLRSAAGWPLLPLTRWSVGPYIGAPAMAILERFHALEGAQEVEMANCPECGRLWIELSRDADGDSATRIVAAHDCAGVVEVATWMRCGGVWWMTSDVVDDLTQLIIWRHGDERFQAPPVQSPIMVVRAVANGPIKAGQMVRHVGWAPDGSVAADTSTGPRRTIPEGA
jgi:hypothetical protein